MDNQLIIPDKLKIGFVKRDDTYSGKLAFITYIKEDGSSKHKAAWENWRDKSLKVYEGPNEPREGFILNRNEGGGGRWSYSEREAKIRVWDPAGFEFEITIPNMLEILTICGSYPGKGLDGKFVYAFDGNRLTLLPIKSEQYKNSMEFTDLSKLSITKEDLHIGGTYICKDQEKVIYMGQFPWINVGYYSSSEAKVTVEHIFYTGNKKNPDYDPEDEDGAKVPEFIEQFAPKKIPAIAKCLDQKSTPNFAEIMDKLQASGFVFTGDKVTITKTKVDTSSYYKDHYRNYNNYLGDPVWIKKDENTYERVSFMMVFPPATSYERTIKPNGVRIMYSSKMVITPDGPTIKKSSKVDKKVYTPKELSDMEFYKIQLNTTQLVTASLLSYTWMKKTDRANDIRKYSLKDLA